jgi:hypothetical protein
VTISGVDLAASGTGTATATPGIGTVTITGYTITVTSGNLVDGPVFVTATWVFWAGAIVGEAVELGSSATDTNTAGASTGEAL